MQFLLTHLFGYLTVLNGEHLYLDILTNDIYRNQKLLIIYLPYVYTLGTYDAKFTKADFLKI